MRYRSRENQHDEIKKKKVNQRSRAEAEKIDKNNEILSNKPRNIYNTMSYEA